MSVSRLTPVFVVEATAYGQAYDICSLMMALAICHGSVMILFWQSNLWKVLNVSRYEVSNEDNEGPECHMPDQ